MKKQDDFIMLPTVDFCFKELMGNPNVRKNFIAALLRVEPGSIKDTIMLPTILGRDYPGDKQGILDVRVLLWDGTQLNVEMQVRSDPGWNHRAMFYESKLYMDQIRRGDDYEDVMKSIHVGILNYQHNPGDERCFRSFHFRDDETGELLSDTMEIQIFELKKMSGVVDPEEDILVWMKFFSGKNKEELMAIAKEHEFLKEAYDDLERMSADDIKRAEYDAREKAEMDYRFAMNSAKKAGRLEGRLEGERSGMCAMVSACQSLGATRKYIAQQIAESFHLTLEEATETVHDMMQ